MKTRHIKVHKTARCHIMGTPGPGIARLWVVLHGYGQLAGDFLENFKTLDNGENVIVAPEALHRFYLRGGTGPVGASWMTREDREFEIEDYVAYLDAVAAELLEEIPQKNVKIYVLGFSQGTATAARWALRGRCRPQALVIWGGGLPPEIDFEAHRDLFATMETILVYGREDPYISPAFLRQQERLLDDNRVAYRLLPFNGGHEINPGILNSLY